MKNPSKKELYASCETFVTEQIDRIRKNIAQIENALTSETKSSAGDKHETGRAMLQLEREKLGKQLWEAEKTAQLLRRIPLSTPSDRAVLGSLVQTDTGFYYIAISAGKVELNGQTVFCISARTPIAQKLLGRTIGGSFWMNEIEQTVLAIF